MLYHPILCFMWGRMWGRNADCGPGQDTGGRMAGKSQNPITTDRQVAAFMLPEGRNKARRAVSNRGIGGLALEARTTREAKTWVFRFRLAGNAVEMALGRYPGMSLAEAREKHRDAAKLVEKGIDPRKHRKAEKARNEAAWTMGHAFERWIVFYEQTPGRGKADPQDRGAAQGGAATWLPVWPTLTCET